MQSTHLGIAIPTFLDPDYDHAWDTARNRIGFAQAPYRLFHMAWHGVGYRSIAMERREQDYCKQPKYGSAGHEGNFIADQTLVDFLSAACSTLDCFAFAAYALAAARRPAAFPYAVTGDLVAATRQNTAGKFQLEWPLDPLTDVLIRIRDEPRLRSLFAMRDVPTHRGVLPRTTYVGGAKGGSTTVPSKPKALPDDWISDLTLDCTTIKNFKSDVAGVLTNSTSKMKAFAEKI